MSRRGPRSRRLAAPLLGVALVAGGTTGLARDSVTGEPPGVDLGQVTRLAEAGRADEARALALESADAALARDPARFDVAARALLLAGRIDADAHRADDALGHLQRAVRAAVAAGDREIEREATELIGLSALVSGRPGLAVRSMTRSLALIETLGAEPLRARGHGLLGLAQQNVGLFEQALESYGRAASIYARDGIAVGEFGVLLNIGTIEGQWLERPRDAIASFERARAITDAHPALPPELTGLVHLNLAESRADSGALDVAAEEIGRALRIVRRAGHRAYEAAALVIASEIARRRGHADGAEAEARRAVELAERLGDLQTLRRAHLAHGRALTALNRPGDAADAFSRAADLLERLRREIGVEEMQIAFLRDKRETYEALIGQLLALDDARPDRGWDGRAFAASEASRARSFIDHLPRPGAAPAVPPPLDLSGVQALLAPGELLVELFAGPEQAWLFAVTADALDVVDGGPSSDLGRRVAALRGSLASRTGDRAFEQTIASELFERLLAAPLARHEPRRLVVVPDGPLAALPIHVLLGASPRHAALPVSTVPSASLLARTRPGSRSSPTARTDRPVRILAVGLPDARHPRLGPLPALARAEEEARAAAAYARASDRVLLTGSVAEDRVRSALRDGAADVVHFATHAIVGEGDPGEGGLVLHRSADDTPGSGTDDGLLSVREIAQLSIPARLVVLSGCTTAGNEIAPGEGVLGLGRSFLRAGADALLVTAWDVSDDAAYRLTRAFYAHAASGAPLDAALARARTDLADLPDARAFVLVGDGTFAIEGLRAPGLFDRAWAPRSPLAAALLLAGAALAALAVIALVVRRRASA